MKTIIYFILAAGLIACVITGQACSAAPGNLTELQARKAELRQQFLPFLESRPTPMETRRRQELSGDDWLSRFEIKRVSDKPVLSMAPVPALPGCEKETIDSTGWHN